MLYVVYGTDFAKKNAKKEELLKVLHLKRPDAESFTLDKENFTEDALRALYSSQGLFEKKQIVVLNGLLEQKKAKTEDDTEEQEDKGTKKVVMEALPELAASESMFLLIDGPLDPKTIKEFEKNGAKMYSYGEKVAAIKDNLVFQMCDAFGAKDKKNAWVIYQQLLRRSEAPEAIHGALWSAVKGIYLAKKTKNATEAGIHPFVYDKSIRFARNFTEAELENLLAELVDMYHLVRMEGGELSVSLEKFLLK